MEDTDFIIKDSPKIEVVARLGDLFARGFDPAFNACAYHRTLTQDFNALARHLAATMDQGQFVRHLDYDDLANLRTQMENGAEREALDFMLKDADALLDFHRPGFTRLSCRVVRVNPAEKDSRAGAETFHADGEADDPYFENVICTYSGQPTEYIAAPGAQVQSFGLGNIWRFACQNSEAVSPPLIHRAPRVCSPDAPRLLLMLTRSNRALWPAFEV